MKKAPRLLLGAIAGLSLAAGAPPSAFAKPVKCVDPVTKAVTWTEVCRWPQGPTPAEDAASAEAMRIRSLEDEARKRVVREDRQLLTKHPDAARHRRAHLDELAEVSRKMRVPTARFWTLTEERKPLDVPAAFYVGKPMPPDLKRRIDASEAAFAALVDVFGDLQLELAQVDARFANERDRLGRLWSGAPWDRWGRCRSQRRRRGRRCRAS